MRRKIKLNSIVIKYFVVICIFIVAPIIIFFLLAQNINTKTALQQKRRSDLAALNTFASTVSQQMTSMESIGKLIAKDKQIQDFMKKAKDSQALYGKKVYKSLDYTECLKVYENTEPSVCALGLIDTEGYFIGEQHLNPNRLSYFFSSLFMKPISTSDLTWTSTFSIESLDTGKTTKVLSLLVPVESSQHAILGYLVLFIDTHRFDELLAAYDDDIYVLENEYIIGSKKELPPHTYLYSIFQINYGYLLNDSSVIINEDTNPLIVTTQNYAPLNFRLLLVSSYQDLKDNSGMGLPNLFTIAIYGVFFSIIASIFIARFQTMPIIYLRNIMNHVKSGNFDIRFQSSSKDEIAELGFTFNSLLDTVQHLMYEQKVHQKQKQKMELQMIQEQVKPHFLYNVLEMINSMIRCQMYPQALETVENLASFYRISLNNGSNIIRISREIQLIENYLCLQKMRYIEFIDYTLAFSPQIYDYLIPKLTLQPLIENAIYHGIKEKGTKEMLCVTGYMENSRIIFEVFDTGNGIPPEKITELEQIISSEQDIEEHFGLASVVKRLNIHCNNQAKLTIESKPGEYTCVTISFPALKNAPES